MASTIHAVDEMGGLPVSRAENEMETRFYDYFKTSASVYQLEMLSRLLKLSSADVKYKFAKAMDNITKLDIIGLLPVEIFEKIFCKFDLKTLLVCRLVSRCWNYKVGMCDRLWLPQCDRYCINLYNFYPEEFPHESLNVNRKVQKTDLNVIGARMFEVQYPAYDSLLEKTYADVYVAGRNLLTTFGNQAEFRRIIDQDCRGSNVVMTMNDYIIAYAREDRHIVVKYTSFPHKLISTWVAHQCADLLLYECMLISGGYDRCICGWHWRTGQHLFTLEGSINAVFSVNVLGSLLVSSDGKSVITWNLPERRMLTKTPCCFDDTQVEELLMVDVCSVPDLKEKYDQPLLLTRSRKELKVWLFLEDGIIQFLRSLKADRPFENLQPFLRTFNGTVACSSEFGIHLWSLSTFQQVHYLDRPLCAECELSILYDVGAHRMTANCRTILLYCSDTIILQFSVHRNIFQLLGTKDDSKLNITWKFPSNEKWPWSHRKPGIASLVLNMTDGLKSCSKLSIFVGTLGKKIYNMLFDFSDLDGFYDHILSDLSVKLE